MAETGPVNFYKIVLRLPEEQSKPHNGICDLDYEYWVQKADASAGRQDSDWKPIGTHAQPLYLKRPGKLMFGFRDDTGRIVKVEKILVDFTPLRHGIASPLSAEMEAKGESGTHYKVGNGLQKGVEVAIGDPADLVDHRRFYGLRVEIDAIDVDNHTVKLVRDDPEVVVEPQPG